jgi:Tol biopolymer transport system component
MIRKLNLTRFDLAGGGAILLLAGAILLTIAGGDRAGVTITTFTPEGNAHTTTPIHITFADPMNTASVESHVSIDPPVVGKFTWSGNQLTFTPAIAFAPRATYTVTIRAGAENTQGRRIAADVIRQFSVSDPRVVYLAPAVRDQNFDPPNLWMVDPATADKPKQVTFAKLEVIDFQPSPDGTRIAYSQRADDHSGTADIYVLTVETGTVQQVTRCVKAICQSPNWNPDGQRLAYERIETNADLPNTDRGQARTWLLNLTDLSTVPLSTDSQVLGSEPRWSPDGSTIAVYDGSKRAIVVYDLIHQSAKIIPTAEVLNGVFDPAGGSLTYPDLGQINGEYINVLWIADLANPQNGKRPLNLDSNKPTEDQQPDWNRDGKRLAVLRRYLDTGGTYGPQLYILNVADGSVIAAENDPAFTSGSIHWNPSGDQIVMQRRSVFGGTEGNDSPNIWVYDVQSKALTQIATDGYLPQWLP